MRKILLMSAALLGAASGAAYAQNSTSTTTSPPAPNASVGVPNPSNSIPSGSGTATRNLPGSDVGTTGVGPGSAMPAATGTTPMDHGMTGVRPLRGQHRQAQDGVPAHGRRGHHGAPAAAGIDAPRGGEYRGGAGSPLSTRASNTTGANTRSEIAPRLPDPAAAANTPQAYLAAAERALAANRTGAAQEALERAETRVLSRSTDPSLASTPDNTPMVQQIGQARRALAARDTAGARSAISAAMATGS